MREPFQSQSQITHKSRLDLIHACRCVETPSLIFPYSMHTSKFPFTLTTCQFTAAAYRKTKFSSPRKKMQKMVFCWIVLQFSSRLLKVTYLSHAMCHVLSATKLTALFYNTVLLSSTVRILIYSRIREIVIKYNVRKTVNPILFRLRPFCSC